jgi:omega-amidase
MEQISQVFRLAVCQVKTITDKPENLLSAKRLIEKAVLNKAEIIVLPEMWNTPFTNDYFIKFAEPPLGPTYQFMKTLAQTHKIYLVGGSIPVSRDQKIFNTSYCFDPDGNLIANYSKCH